MSEERLYQPDFSCIFGSPYANAFQYGQVDSIVWPIFDDIPKSDKLSKLLALKNPKGRNYFYRRKITLDDEKLELDCSNIKIALIQAMELGREYGIDNTDVINVVKKDRRVFKGILSFDPRDENSLQALKSLEGETSIAGIVFYPSYLNMDLSKDETGSIKDFISYCKSRNYFIKLDLGNQFLPNNYAENISHVRFKTIISKFPDNIFIISGLDISGDFNLYYQLLKYYNNLWLEIDPRTFGGMTPKDIFNTLFKIKGFIQNAWHRVTLGSATPTLEISQMIRGFLEATEVLPFSQKLLLRSWAFRNINRINQDVFKPIKQHSPELFKKVLEEKHIQSVENSCEVNISYQLKLRSQSITQLLFLTEIIENILEKTLEKYPNLNCGELLIRTYHTTTTFIINEHEYGNYLDLHYKFAEISKFTSEEFLHTVGALENRADFNHFDHELASTYGTKQLLIPILNRKLEIGGRENFYVLVTFGPRTFNLFFKIRLFKEMQ